MEVNQVIQLTIHNLGNSGEGVGLHEGCVVFVEGALPGETVEVRLVDCRKKYARAELLSVLIPSEDRIIPPCPLFDRCGGCQIMHLDYAKQLEMKQKKVQDALQRIGKITDVEVPLCLPSPLPLGYRNKIQLPVRPGKNGIMLGLYARSSHDLVEVEHCLIHCPLGEEVYAEIRQILQNSAVSAFNPSTGVGELRHVLIKSAVHTRQVLIILVTNSREVSPELLQVAKEIKERCPVVKGIVQNINIRRDNVILGEEYRLLEGQNYIHESIGGLLFKVSPGSFFQVNPKQAECLYAKALEYAELTGHEVVLDAYCGVGTLSLLFARYAKHVKGVECVQAAIDDALENASLNGIGNVSFVCANAEEFIQKQSYVDLILLNPPRQGCHPSLLEKVGDLLPATVIYISCDPATLARDLAMLYTFGYKIDAIQPYDMFPQTAHVECVVKLVNKQNF